MEGGGEVTYETFDSYINFSCRLCTTTLGGWPVGVLHKLVSGLSWAYINFFVVFCVFDGYIIFFLGPSGWAQSGGYINCLFGPFRGVT